MELHNIKCDFKREIERRRVNRERATNGLTKLSFKHFLIPTQVMSMTGAALKAQAKGKGLTKAEFAELTKASGAVQPTSDTSVNSPGKGRKAKSTTQPTVSAKRMEDATKAFDRAMKADGLKAAKWAHGLVMHHERANGSHVPQTTAATAAVKVHKAGGTWQDLLKEAKVVTA